MEGGGLEQGLEVGPVALLGGGGPGAHRLEDIVTLGGDVGDGLVDALFGQDAGHLLEDAGGGAFALDFGKGGGQFLDAGQADGVGVVGGLPQALALLPVFDGLGLGQLAAMGVLDGLQEVGADLLGVDHAGLLDAV